MTKFVLAAVTALSLGIGSAYAAQTSNQDNGARTSQAPQSFLYTPSGG